MTADVYEERLTESFMLLVLGRFLTASPISFVMSSSESLLLESACMWVNLASNNRGGDAEGDLRGKVRT